MKIAQRALSQPAAAVLAVCILALVRPISASGGSGQSISAVEKVIALLTNLAAEGQQMKHDEAVEYAKFSQFCTDQTATLSAFIEKAEEKITSLTAQTEQLGAAIEDLNTKITALTQAAEKAKVDLAETKAEGAKNQEDLADEVQDYIESVDALDRAIEALKRRSGDVPATPEALVQLEKSVRLPSPVKRGVTAFLAMAEPDDYLFREAPEANAYEFQSSNLLEILGRLRAEFTQKRIDAEKSLLNSRHANTLAQQDLTDFIAHSTADATAKTATKEAKVSLKGETTKQLQSVTADHAEATETLSSLKIECEEKAKSFDEKQKLREDELVAIKKAIEILSSPDVLGAAQEHLPALTQASSRVGSSLAQLRAAARIAPKPEEMVFQFLKAESRRLHSDTLSLLTSKIASSAAANPFGKVKRLIEDLIAHLTAEINNEIQQKGFCDKELGTNKITRTRLQEEMDALTASMEENKALNTEASQDISTLSTQISELQAAIKEATELRTSEKAKNTAAIEDAKKAQEAILAAKKVLTDFYAKAATATALLQAKQQPVKMGSEEWQYLANTSFEGEMDWGHKAGMQTFGATYTGQQSGAGSVLAVLEVVESDFAQLEADTQAAEMEAAKLYADFMEESERDVKVKQKAVDMTAADKTKREAKLVQQKADWSDLEDQMLSAQRYYDTLKPQCVDTGISYEDRVKGREEEIESLKKALEILKGQATGPTRLRA
mmetsp:Transcript_64527/g.154119  ORF Transcript_64527/g.154119 Transcript_64527/m.154119 type:complete len:725 (-) Transcript_64527:116-2290(-)